MKSEYYVQKCREVRAHINKFMRRAWDKKEEHLGRALTANEIKDAFGWTNKKGKYQEPRKPEAWRTETNDGND